MSVWNSRGRRRAVGRKIAPFLGIASSIVIFIIGARTLWLAYATHSIFIPIRRGRDVVLEHEPGFFWTAVVIYLIVTVCAPLAAASQISDIRFALRYRKS